MKPTSTPIFEKIISFKCTLEEGKKMLQEAGEDAARITESKSFKITEKEIKPGIFALRLDWDDGQWPTMLIVDINPLEAGETNWISCQQMRARNPGVCSGRNCRP